MKHINNEFAFVSVVLGILSFITVFGMEKPITAVLFGCLALRRIAINKAVDGKRLAYAGITLGIVQIIGAVALIFYFRH
jgi:hypothetical protein